MGDDPAMFFLRPVRKIQAGHVHPGPDEPLQDFRGPRGGPDGADDFRFDHGLIFRRHYKSKAGFPLPLGIKGVVVGQGDTYEEALADLQSAIRFHIESFGESVLDKAPVA
jgi:hypothetical protein